MSRESRFHNSADGTEEEEAAFRYGNYTASRDKKLRIAKHVNKLPVFYKIQTDYRIQKRLPFYSISGKRVNILSSCPTSFTTNFNIILTS
jgi:hypothetical protein